MPVDCEHCGREFDTTRGLKTHIGIKHDPLPKEKAVELYVRQDMTCSEIAEHLGISDHAVSDRLTEYNLWKQDPCKFYLEDDQGYPVIRKTGTQRQKRIRVHRLVAIAKGYSPHHVFSGEYDVDHVNNCKLDNRPENIQLLKKDEHGSKHGNQVRVNQYGPY